MGGDTVSGSGELHTAKQRDQARIARVVSTGDEGDWWQEIR